MAFPLLLRLKEERHQTVPPSSQLFPLSSSSVRIREEVPPPSPTTQSHPESGGNGNGILSRWINKWIWQRSSERGKKRGGKSSGLSLARSPYSSSSIDRKGADLTALFAPIAPKCVSCRHFLPLSPHQSDRTRDDVLLSLFLASMGVT